MLSYGLVIRGSHRSAFKGEGKRGLYRGPAAICTPRASIPNSFFMSSPSTGTFSVRRESYAPSSQWIPITSDERVPPTNLQVCIHGNTDIHTGRLLRTGLRNALTSGRSPSSRSRQPCGGGLYFCPGRPFTIGNLHKRLTEAKLNHTREREKNRRASKLFVCMRESEDTFPVWKRQRKRKRTNLDEEEEEQRGRKLAVRGGRGEETRRREGRR